MTLTMSDSRTEYQESLDEVLYGLIKAVFKTAEVLDIQIREVAEKHWKTTVEVEEDLRSRLEEANYTKEMVRVIPKPIRDKLGIK